jgi:hypothetical protein
MGTLPTLIKTYEFIHASLLGTSDTDFNYKVRRLIKNMLTDVVNPSLAPAHIYNRGIIQLVSGVTFRINPADGTFAPATIGSVVGKTMLLRGMTSVANDGNYVVTGQVDTGGGVYALEYTNASGVAESIVGSVNVRSGALTTPWEMDQSGFGTAPGTHIGQPGDEVDRLEVLTNFIVDNGSSGFYMVLRNPVTKSQIMFTGNRGAVNSQALGLLAGTCSPYTFDVARTGFLSPAPTVVIGSTGVVTPQTIFNPEDSGWFIGNGNGECRISLLVSTDGEQTRMPLFYGGFCPAVFCEGLVYNPPAQWSAHLAPDEPAFQAWRRFGGIATIPLFIYLNDVAIFQSSELPSLSPNSLPDPVALFYLTAEGFISSANAQNITVADEVTGDWPFYTISLASDSVPSRAVVGSIPDLWWGSTGLALGTTYPAGSSRQFLHIGNIIIPWDGSIPELI